jgi:hypothetical protein
MRVVNVVTLLPDLNMPLTAAGLKVTALFVAVVASNPFPFTVSMLLSELTTNPLFPSIVDIAPTILATAGELACTKDETVVVTDSVAPLFVGARWVKLTIRVVIVVICVLKMTPLTGLPGPDFVKATLFSVGVVASNPFPWIVSLLLEDDRTLVDDVTFGSVSTILATSVEALTDHVFPTVTEVHVSV